MVKVFISYAQIDGDTDPQVKQLAGRLRNETSIEVIFDQFSTGPGGPDGGWNLWCETLADTAERILIVVTEAYLRRWNREEEGNQGYGAAFEATIIRNRLAENRSNNNFCRVVLVDPNDRKYIPTVLNDATQFCFPDTYHEIVSWICGERAQTVPVNQDVPQTRSYLRGFLLKRAYLNALRLRYGLFNDKGLGLINANRLKLDQVFVSLRIVRAFNVGQAKTNIVAPIDDLENDLNDRSAWDFIRNLREDGMALAVIGAPGSGKTTLLQHILLILANNQNKGRYRVRNRLPVLLYLRDIQHDIVPESVALEPTLAQVIHRDTAKNFPNLAIPPDWFERELQYGRLLVLLDGLDEVGSEDRRLQVSAWLDRQIERYEKSRLIVTARPQGYRTAPLHRADVLEVCHFSPDQVRAFVRNWYHANEVVSRGNLDNAEVRAKSAEESNDLLERLRGVPALLELTSNPMLLTMICMVHRYRGELPGGRFVLYEEICKVLLDKWRQGKQITDNLSGDQKKAVLMPLAAEMMERGVREIDGASALSIMETTLKEVGLNEEMHGRFLQNLAEESGGLLQEIEVGQWAFAHLTFQEFLTATWWVESHAPSDGFENRTAATWWHETLRLYCSKADATAIVEACLNQSSSKALALGFTCLEEAHKVSPKSRERIEFAVRDCLESSNQQLFANAAKAWHEICNSRGFVQTVDGAELRQTPVNKAEYQLFAAETGRWPDHWIGRRFEPGTALDPVCGLRPSDALAYTQWLSNDSEHFRPANLSERTAQNLEQNLKAEHSLQAKGRSLTEKEQKAFALLIGIRFPENINVLGEIPEKLQEADNIARAISWGIGLGYRVDNRALARNRRSLKQDFGFVLMTTLNCIISDARSSARVLDIARTRARALALELDSDLDIALMRAFQQSSIPKKFLENWINTTDQSSASLEQQAADFIEGLSNPNSSELFTHQSMRFWLAMMRLVAATKRDRNKTNSLWQSWILAGAEICLLIRASLVIEDKTNLDKVRLMESTAGFLLTALCRQIGILDEGPALFLVRESNP